MKTSSFLLLFLMFIWGCNPQSGNVELQTKNIFNQPLFTINELNASNTDLDLGEFLLTDTSMPLLIEINNKTDYPYTELDLIFDAADDISPAIQYKSNSEGIIQFPGEGGSCKNTLAPKTKCTINALFYPREGRTYNEIVTLKFKNLVSSEEHVVRIKILAGMPASLVFTEDKTRYIFGDEVGIQKIPVIERDEKLTYEKILEIKNGGGLSAKNLTITHTELCNSTSNNLCPDGMDDVYEITSECPKKLGPDETCQVKVSYSPKNQDPPSGPIPDEIKEIYYKSTINFKYISDTKNSERNLNGFFNSLSTNIQAKFKVTMDAIVFEDKILSGNRDIRAFRIINYGYREGLLQSISVRDSDGSMIGTCRAEDATSILKCFKPDNSVLSLADFPFTIKDKDKCLAPNGMTPTVIAVEGGCIFDLTFQPSVTYLEDKQFNDLQPEITYDSRWKGRETILSRKLFNLSAESQAAARIVLDRVSYLGTTYTATGDVGPWVTDFKRLTLQSSNYFMRKPIQLTFKNVGKYKATGITLRDGLNRAITIGGSTTLGSHTPFFYTSVTGSSSCEEIGPNELCTISTQFAAIGLNTNQEETENMFDGIDSLGDSFKKFSISYQSGASFTDANLEGDVDYPIQTAASHIKATLVRKGLLLDLQEDPKNFSDIGLGNVNSHGDESLSYVYLTNIGSGPITYIRLWNAPSLIGQGVELLPTPNPLDLGAQQDCLNLVDIPSVMTTEIMPEVRASAGGLVASLPKDEKCVFTVRVKAAESQRFKNPYSCRDPVTLALSKIELGSRLTTGEWEFCRNLYMSNTGQGWDRVSFSYFDGDTTAPGRLSPTYGNRFELPEYARNFQTRWPAKLIPDTFSPWLTATLYRPSITLPPTSNSPSINIAPAWFFGSVPGSFLESAAIDLLNVPAFSKAEKSRNYVTTMSSFNPAGYDYVFYVGSFPVGSPNVAVSLPIANYGGRLAKLIDIDTSSVDPAFVINSLPSIPDFINPLANFSPQITLSTAVPGEKSMILSYEYNTGEVIETMIYKSSASVPDNAASATSKTRVQRILILANITDSAPNLAMSVNDFDIIQNDGAPPSVTMLTPSTPSVTTLNTQNPAETIVFESMKITATPTANDIYAVKRINFTNDSDYPLHGLEISFRSTAVSATVKDLSSSFTLIASQSTCTAGATLLADESCYLSYKFQPRGTDTNDGFVLTATYRSENHEYFMKNLGISLNPISPGSVIPLAMTSEAIKFKPVVGAAAVDRTSFFFNIGTVALTTIPMTYSLSRQLNNPISTKTSLLLAYHKYLQANNLRGYNNSTPVPTSVVPLTTDYRTVGAYQYTKIFSRKYADNSERMVIEASKGCLFGDDENNALIPHFKKGFNVSTTTPNSCQIIITFNANFDYLLKTIAINNGDDMRDAAAEIWYFSVNRTSSSSLWFHVKGVFNPPTSVALGSDTYTGHQSFDNPKMTQFFLPRVAANAGGLGPIVGIRVLRSTSRVALNDPYLKTHTNFIDIPYSYDDNFLAQFTSGFVNGTFYFYRAVAIRYDARFAHSAARFNGLSSGRYLSTLSNLATVQGILMPPLNHFYFHTPTPVIVEKSLRGGQQVDKYATSSSRCTSTTVVLKNNGANVVRGYSLINKSTWDRLVLTPAATSYNDFTRVAHWLSENITSIDARCSMLPNFIPGQASQTLESSSVFYIRSPGNPSAQVRTVAGGVPGTSYSGFTSYIAPEINFGSARCHVSALAP